jgi:hypothetical protein
VGGSGKNRSIVVFGGAGIPKRKEEKRKEKKRKIREKMREKIRKK